MTDFPNKDTQFKEGQTGNPNGRPRKFVSSVIKELKDKGIEPLKARDYIEIIECLFNLTYEEIKDIAKDDNQSYHTRTVAVLFLKNPEKAHAEYSDRVFGKSKQTIEQTNKNFNYNDMTIEQIDELLKKYGKTE